MKPRDYSTYPAETAALLQWYDQSRRILPWREDPTPYHIWLSEIMLQQTRVGTVIDYYHRFLEALPTVEALANAEEELLLKLWQGLGYYSRVRNMHKAAKQVMQEFGGQIPSSPKELATLSGIGPYAAAAIASIAFGVPVPSVDGNLLRVWARTQGYEESIKTPAAKKQAETYYQTILPPDRPGDMNQALMDLGATICLPNGAPECGRCPWSNFCSAFRNDRQEDLPVKDEKKARKVEQRTIFLLTGNGQVALRKRPTKGLLANLWEFPGAEGHLSEEEARHFAEGLGCSVQELSPLPRARHIFSHVEWDMIGYRVDGTWEPDGNDNFLVFVTKKEMEQQYSIPTAFSAYAKLFE